MRLLVLCLLVVSSCVRSTESYQLRPGEPEIAVGSTIALELFRTSKIVNNIENGDTDRRTKRVLKLTAAVDDEALFDVTQNETGLMSLTAKAVGSSMLRIDAGPLDEEPTFAIVAAYPDRLEFTVNDNWPLEPAIGLDKEDEAIPVPHDQETRLYMEAFSGERPLHWNNDRLTATGFAVEAVEEGRIAIRPVDSQFIESTMTTEDLPDWSRNFKSFGIHEINAVTFDGVDGSVLVVGTTVPAVAVPLDFVINVRALEPERCGLVPLADSFEAPATPSATYTQPKLNFVSVSSRSTFTCKFEADFPGTLTASTTLELNTNLGQTRGSL